MKSLLTKGEVADLGPNLAVACGSPYPFAYTHIHTHARGSHSTGLCSGLTTLCVRARASEESPLKRCSPQQQQRARVLFSSPRVEVVFSGACIGSCIYMVYTYYIYLYMCRSSSCFSLACRVRVLSVGAAQRRISLYMTCSRARSNEIFRPLPERADSS